MSRYDRHIILSEIGREGQNKLSEASVLVIGAGGLGCAVLQYLTAAGIGTIGIVDFDIVTESNLQRQILYGSSSLGLNKAKAAKHRLQDLNNTINIYTYPEKLTHKNAINLFEKYDIIVDGTDNFDARYLINDASILTNKPLVYAGIYKFEGQVSVFNYQNGPSYRCLFPNSPQEGSIPNCSEIGVLGVLPGIIGTMQANEVLKIILGLGNVLTGKVLYYNALTVQSTSIKLIKIESEIEKVLAQRASFQDKIEIENCELLVSEIALKNALKMKNLQFIDVREYYEQPKVEGLGVIEIPLSNFENELNKIASEKNSMIFCKSGIRSKTAVSILKKHQINNSFSIKEGASEIMEYLEKNKKQIPNQVGK